MFLNLPRPSTDSRRWIALVLAIRGMAIAVVGMAASPDPPPMGNASIGPIVLGAAFGGYLRHRGTPLASAWALAYGAGVALAIFATFGAAVRLRPMVSERSDLEVVWSGLIVGGFLVSLAGSWLCERDRLGRRSAGRALLGLWLLVAGVFAWMSSDPWPLAAAPAVLLGFVLLLVGFAGGRPARSASAALSWTMDRK